ALLGLAVADVAAGLEVRPPGAPVRPDAHEELRVAGEHLDAIDALLLAVEELFLETVERLLDRAGVDGTKLARRLERRLDLVDRLGRRARRGGRRRRASARRGADGDEDGAG